MTQEDTYNLLKLFSKTISQRLPFNAGNVKRPVIKGIVNNLILPYSIYYALIKFVEIVLKHNATSVILTESSVLYARAADILMEGNGRLVVSKVL